MTAVDKSFVSAPESVPAARRFVLGQLDNVPSDAREIIGLLVSEVVTNAVRHGGTEFHVSAQRTDDSLLVSVTDRGGGRPEVQSPPPTEPHGRGLLIVSKLAHNWGVVPSAHGAGKTVWFRLEVAG